MKLSHLLLMLLCFSSTLSFAEEQKPLQCFVSINKSAEWNNFDLHVDMFSMSETAARKIIMSFDLPKTSPIKEATNSVKQFDCHKFQRFIFTATYTPAIWHDPEGKPIGNTSDSKGVFDISSQVAKPSQKQNNLIITLNFPADFNINDNPNVLIQPKAKK